MIHITHIIGTLDPAAGGPPVVATRLAAAQAATGHDVRIFHNDGKLAPSSFVTLTEGVPGFDRVHVQAIAPGRGIDRLRGAGMRHTLGEMIDRHHMLHLHGVWEPLLRAAGLAADEAGARYCIAPHGMLDPWSLRQRAFKKRLAMRLGYRRLLTHAAFIHALNPDEARLLEPLGLHRPIEVIANGVFPEEFDHLPPFGTFRQRHNLHDDAPIVLFLGRLHEKKGLDHLAEAFVRLARDQPEVTLVVAGPDGGMRKTFDTMLCRAGLRNRVLLTGPLFGTEKLAAMVDATCFCLPSRQEGFSVAIIEALACGLPVVASEGCHFHELQDAGAGLVVPLDAHRIADALRRVLTDEHLRQAMSERGKALVRHRYTWPRIANDTIAAYHRAAEHESPGSSDEGRRADE